MTETVVETTIYDTVLETVVYDRIVITANPPAPDVVEVPVTPAPDVVEVVARGPQGPNQIAGVPFAINGLAEGDVLSYGSAAWRNRRQENLTDGGNF